MRLAVLGVPSSAGAYGVGQETAPAALREVGLIETLRAHELDVVDRGDTSAVRFSPDPTSRLAQNLAEVVRVAGEVAQAVASTIREGMLPLVIGGDCTITLGVVAGMLSVEPEVSLAYFDGDVDLSTPDTTRSGVLDAMGVAHLLDLKGAAEPLAAIGERRPLLRGTHVALIGFEESDLGEREQALLKKRGVHCYPAAQVRADPSATAARALKALGDRGRLIVHFDVDALDSIDSPLAHFPHFNTGVTLETATACLAALCSSPNLGAVVVTEINPLHDPDGQELSRLVQALSIALERSPRVTRATSDI